MALSFKKYIPCVVYTGRISRDWFSWAVCMHECFRPALIRSSWNKTDPAHSLEEWQPHLLLATWCLYIYPLCADHFAYIQTQASGIGEQDLVYCWWLSQEWLDPAVSPSYCIFVLWSLISSHAQFPETLNGVTKEFSDIENEVTTATPTSKLWPLPVTFSGHWLLWAFHMYVLLFSITQFPLF